MLFVLLYVVLIVRVPFPFSVWGRNRNSIVLVPEHCLSSTFHDRIELIKNGIYFAIAVPDNNRDLHVIFIVLIKWN